MKPWISLGALLATLYINYLANALPINGLTTGDISGMFDNAFVPAGFTFAIWGIIYLLLLVFVLLQVVSSLSGKKLPFQESLDKMQPWFWLSCGMNSLWILAFHYQQWLLSLGVMVVLLFSLLQIYAAAQPIRNYRPQARAFFYHAPFSVYLGWINVATIANVTLLLVAFQVQLPYPELWSVLLMTVAGVLALVFLKLNKDVLFSGVIIWALYGIHKGQADFPWVSFWALGELVVLVALVLWQVIRWTGKKQLQR